MSQAYFRFSTDILRRLGEELNPSPDQGILELVKNAYDADARSCIVELVNTDNPGGTIRILDDGDGMDVDAIRDGWLVLGSSLKSPQQRTRLGRIPAGSKGLGRLAALRMGKVASLTTWPKQVSHRQYRLRIDWSDYDDARLVDDVPLEIEQTSLSASHRTGTEVEIKDLRLNINRMDVQRLARALILLADPFGDDPESFKPQLKAPEFEDLESLVQNRYFHDAEYHLTAHVDADGKARAAVIDFKGKELFSAEHRDLSPKNAPYYCPPADFDLWAFILDKPTFSTRSSTLKEVKDWLRTFGGVHLYQNGLRVSPYGNQGNDWLDLNLSRSQRQEESPSTNNSIGRVSLTDTQDLLVQKTDRSGFIESETFLEIKRFAKDALDWMFRRRLAMAEVRREKERTEAPSRSQKAQASVRKAIEKLPERSRSVIANEFNKYERTREKELEALRAEVQLYRTLSTAGITAATFAHESAGNPLKVITLAAKTLDRRGRESLGAKYELTLEEPVNLILKSSDALKVLGNVTLSLIDHEKRRASRVDIHRTIKGVINMFSPFLNERDVVVTKDFDRGNPYLRGSEAAVEAVVTNLLNNSLAWLEKSGDRRVIIRTRISENALTLSVLDSGPGIEGIGKDDIWLPGQTTRPNGTGLGLTIVRDTVKDLGGDVDAIEHSELGGAEIIVELPILGA